MIAVDCDERGEALMGSLRGKRVVLKSFYFLSRPDARSIFWLTEEVFMLSSQKLALH